jgi:Cu+-exporting ATPase
VAERATELQAEGKTILFVAIDGRIEGILAVVDPIKPTTQEAVRGLRDLGIKIVMATGDNPLTAQAVAEHLDLDRIEAGVDPGGKLRLVQSLKTNGDLVAMAGDGINDAPALAAADVGIAMGTGTDVAMESADITLVKGDLRGIVRAITLSRATRRNIRQNLFFAFAYNALGIPLAAGALYPLLSIHLSPMFAGAVLSISSVTVVLNALRLGHVAK